MRIAFVLLTFRDVVQIRRLVGALCTGSSDHLVVIAHSGSEDERRELRSVEGVAKVLPAAPGRGGFNVVDAAISAMRWLERQPASYDWIAIMSGQDYPVRPIGEFERELAASSCDGYFDHFPVDDAAKAADSMMRWPRSEASDRYHFRYAVLKRQPTLMDRALLKIPKLLLARSRRYRLQTTYGIMVGVRVESLPFTPELRLHGGNFWSVIRRSAVRSVLEFVDERPDVVQHFRNVVVPEEAFFPTILANDPALRLSTRELRFIEFEDGRHGHPRVLDLLDVVRIAATGAYFARKFDIRRDPRILDILDERLARAASATIPPAPGVVEPAGPAAASPAAAGGGALSVQTG